MARIGSPGKALTKLSTSVAGRGTRVPVRVQGPGWGRNREPAPSYFVLGPGKAA